MIQEIFYFESQGTPCFQSNSEQFFSLLLTEADEEGFYEIGTKKFPIAKRQLHYIFHSHDLNWKSTANTKIYQFLINRNNFDLIRLYLRFNQSFYEKKPTINLTGKDFDYLLYEFKEIGKEIDTDFLLNEIICSRIIIILQKAIQIVKHQSSNIDLYFSSNIIYEFLDLIDIHYKEEKELLFYSEKLNITTNYLGVLCKKHLKTSGNKVIKNKLILEAKKRLITPNLSVKEIAFDLGFKEHAHFTNFFKLATGYSPSEFRAKRVKE